MKKKAKLIDALLAHEQTQWEEEDREFLLTLNEEQLQKMLPVANDEEEEDLDEVDEGAGKKKTAKKKVKNAEEETAENTDADEDEEESIESPANEAAEWLKGAPPEVQQMVTDGLQVHNAERNKLVKIIIANEAAKGFFKKDELMKKPLNELRGLAALAKANEIEESDEDDQEEAVQQYFGMAGGPGVRNSGKVPKVEPLEIPRLTFERVEFARNGRRIERAKA